MFQFLCFFAKSAPKHPVFPKSRTKVARVDSESRAATIEEDKTLMCGEHLTMRMWLMIMMAMMIIVMIRHH